MGFMFTPMTASEGLQKYHSLFPRNFSRVLYGGSMGSVILAGATQGCTLPENHMPHSRKGGRKRRRPLVLRVKTMSTLAWPGHILAA